ncbi:energy-coupling factor transporter transmembrane component T family protein [Agromyces seonyuensis]|uniref:Energy-coupling factor transporter transmembrane protein EcfT n=1 Tax=Agromyces seonyuensis TaxID=2662446 RepID=A0A6I4P2G1_9MICO|nr:energy-coupling factor transporter transmembrane component T [Agromyces seonyuensis]MWB97384.1 energy-coupling factor transporter transmembrane protein EcfT [Agromyces seonyuensis]
MSVIGAVRPDLPLAHVNPVAKLAATLPLAIALVLTLDPVSAAVALVLELLVLVAVGFGPLLRSKRLLPIWIAAPLTGLSMLLYGEASGEVHWSFGLAAISDGSIAIALTTVLRVLAIALPGVVLFLTIDPTDLADGLAQTLRLPDRFVLGALAALRLAGGLVDDWRMLALARRARGVADGGPVVRFVRQAFALLVLAVRRGGTLATAMEGRGFGGSGERTWARTAHFGRVEWLVVAVGCAVAALAVAVSVAVGSWNVIWA